MKLLLALAAVFVLLVSLAWGSMDGWGVAA